MKVRIGKYKNWFGPYQLAELLCFWAKKEKDEFGFSKKPDWVHDFGEWLTYGSVEPDTQVGDRTSFFNDDRPTTVISKILMWVNKIKGERQIKIQIDPWDTWGMDHTLSLIIVPMLKQLRNTKHGGPYVDDEDVPDELKSTSAAPKENEWDTDDNHFKRWDYVLDEMIWAFENIADEDSEDQFHTGKSDIYFERLENGMSEMKRGPNDTSDFDLEGWKAFNNRIANGTKLFGKYYRGLWD